MTIQSIHDDFGDPIGARPNRVLITNVCPSKTPHADAIVFEAELTSGDITMPLFYKTVPQQLMKGIKSTGLDPNKAGQIGGATAKAMVATGRQPNKLDVNYTWMGSLTQAEGYAESVLAGSSPIILRITLTDDFVKNNVDDNGDSGHGTRLFITPDCLEFQTAIGDFWAKISSYDGENAYIFGEEITSDSDFED
jgi:hypothetical protein